MSSELSSDDNPSSELVIIDEVCPPALLLCFDECRLRFRAGKRPLLRALIDEDSMSKFDVGGSSGNFANLSSNICLKKKREKLSGFF